MKQTEFARVLTRYLAECLPYHRNVSRNTIKSYSNAFKQLLSYIDKEYTIPPEKLEFTDITATRIQGFLRRLEIEQGIGPATRNQRLAAIKSFYHYAVGEVPEILFEAQKIFQIPSKKQSRPMVKTVGKDALAALLRQPDQTKARGRRDTVIMSLLYDTAARVQELIDIRVCDVRIAAPATVLLTGKGGKSRCVPIMGRTAELLEAYLKECCYYNNPALGKERLFRSTNRGSFTRPGITGILKRHLEGARIACPEIAFPASIHPHMLRHVKALNMLEAGINLIYIRDFLGHVNVTTTEFYLKVDTELKRSVLEKAFPCTETIPIPSWDEDNELMSWLSDLCR
jgi:site-specific recombinase XerD